MLAAAALWPARLAGPLDGAPLDAPTEAVIIGLLLPALIWFHPAALREWAVRALIVVLLLWKGVTAATLAQDGWCLLFTSPTPLFVGQERVPKSWDVRADWLADVPQCSAIMARGYSELERFPAWFYNLPPATLIEPARPSDRPPNVTLQLELDGYLYSADGGTVRIDAGEDVRLTTRLDAADVTAQAAGGFQVDPGLHRVRIVGELVRSHWSLVPRWNGAPLWGAATATVTPPSTVDLWFRPWGRLVPAVLILLIVVVTAGPIVSRAGRVSGLVAGIALATMAAAATGRPGVIRMSPVLLALAVAQPLPRRLRNLNGVYWLVGIPFLALVAVMGAPQAGLFTWYTSGDDWWMFQRFAYRIYMEGFWLEGGEPTFWFQPLYRWVAGALHLVFGDSSIGELFWDSTWALVGAVFSFHVTRVVAGFRWGLAAAVTTLALLLMGPAWYLFGRGLSEITSAGFLYGGALFALRGRRGHVPSVLMAGLLASLAFYTRLNNLPMAIAVAAFAWPVRQPVADLVRPSLLYARASRPVLAGVLGLVAIALWAFTARTYYYTGVPSMLHGTQAGLLSVWQLPDGGGSIAGNVMGSLFMVLTMTDPPRFDVRAVPILVGALVAVLGVLRVRPFSGLPMNAVGLCLAGLSGALVARGSAYPGRFSVHLIPVAVALAVAATALVFKRGRTGAARELSRRQAVL